MIHLALLADAALLLVLLRMVWIGADQSCPREFFFLLSLLCYALLSFAEDFPAWGHASLAFFALPMLLQKVPGARYQVSGAIAAAVIICAAIFGRSAMAAWGGTPAAHWGLLGALLELAASAVLLLQCALVPSAAEGPASNHVLRLRFFIGAHLLLVDGSAFTGVPFPATVFAATLLWLITAATLAPTPDALVNVERLAYSRMTLWMARAASDVIAYPKHQAINRSARWNGLARQSAAAISSAEGTSSKTPAAPRIAPRKATTVAPKPNFTQAVGCGANLSAKPSTMTIPAEETLTTRRATSEKADFMGGFSARGR